MIHHDLVSLETPGADQGPLGFLSLGPRAHTARAGTLPLALDSDALDPLRRCAEGFLDPGLDLRRLEARLTVM